MLCATLDGGVVYSMVAEEALCPVAEQGPLVGEELSEVEPEHQVSVYFLHVVEPSEISLHGVVIKFENCLGVLVGVLQIRTKGSIVGFATHVVGAEFHPKVAGEFFDQNAVNFPLVVKLADHDQPGLFKGGGLVPDELGSHGEGGFGRAPPHHLHHAVALLLDSAVGNLPGLLHLEGLTERNR